MMFLVIPPKDAFAYYNNYVKGYSHMVVPLFEFTKKYVAFLWNSNYQNAFDMLKNALVN